jgi:hypothetical protein
MRPFVLLAFFTFSLTVSGQCPSLPDTADFQGTMTQEQLEAYLARSVCMARFALPKTVDDATFEAYLTLLEAYPPKYIARTSLFWSDWHYNDLFAQAEERICKIHNTVDERIICGAGLMENINRQPFELPWRRGVGAQADDPETGAIKGQIPARVLQAFPEYQGSSFWGYASNPEPGTTTMDSSLFNPALMMGDTQGLNIIPDITKPQTKMWYYWQAIRYIDIGIEAFHFGQTGVICRNDTPDYAHLREVAAKIRLYGQAHARRGLVLLNGGRLGEGADLIFDFTKVSSRTKEAPPLRPNAGGGNAVLGDFEHCGEVYYYCKCQDGGFCANPNSCYDVIYGAPVSGQHPMGWSCDPCPYLAEIDHGVAPESSANNRFVSEAPNNAYKTYGVDEATWFSEQSPDYQQDWAIYAYHKVRCMDPTGFLELPVIRGILDPSSPAYPRFYAPAPLLSTYEAIWSGLQPPQTATYAQIPAVSAKAITASPNDNFYSIDPNNRLSSLSPQGDNTWLTTDLHHQLAQTAAIPESLQPLPSQILESAPGGEGLFYSGTDRMLYHLNLQVPPAMNAMPADERIHAHLIVPADSLLFFIGEDQHIWQYELKEGAWRSSDLHHGINAPLARKSRGRGEGGLVYHDHSLFYINTAGQIVQIHLQEVPARHQTVFQDTNALGGLSVSRLPDTGLFFIGSDLFLHGISLADGKWRIQSPVDIALSLGQAPGQQPRAVPPYRIVQPQPGTLIFPAESGLGGYRKSESGYYQAFSLDAPAPAQAILDIEGSANGRWMVTTFPNYEVWVYELQASSCGPIFPYRPIEVCDRSSLVRRFSEASYLNAQKLENTPGEQRFTDETSMLVFPNPAWDQVKIELEGLNGGFTMIQLFNAQGQLLARQSKEHPVTAAPPESPLSFRFQVSHLPQGVYFLTAAHCGQLIGSQRVLVHRQ